MKNRVTDLLEQQRSHITNAEGHEKEVAIAKGKLLEIQRRRNDRAHLEKLLAQDAGSIRSEEKLSQEQVAIEREISSRSGLASSSRRDAEILGSRIADARFIEAAQSVQAQVSNVANFSAQARPRLDAFATLVLKLQSDALNLIEMLKALPDPAPRQIKNIIDRLQSLFSRALLAEMSKIFKLAVIGFPAVPGDFDAMTGEFFSGTQKAIATLAATRAGGGEGRKLYRCVGHISGISGGLQARDGDVFALLMDDPETQKLGSSGALAEIAAGAKGVAA
jgi:hypothetical protein